MHQETHETCRDDRVPNPDVPRRPLALDPAELAEVRASVEEVRAVIARCRHVE
jgi:hypothetical protein